MSTTTTISLERRMLGEVEMVRRDRWEEIHRRAGAGASIRAIARELDLDRKTVRRCLRHARRLARRQPSPPAETSRPRRGDRSTLPPRARRRSSRRRRRGSSSSRPAPTHLAGPRDRALLSVMLYSLARVSAVLGMRRQDYFG